VRKLIPFTRKKQEKTKLKFNEAINDENSSSFSKSLSLSNNSLDKKDFVTLYRILLNLYFLFFKIKYNINLDHTDLKIKKIISNNYFEEHNINQIYYKLLQIFTISVSDNSNPLTLKYNYNLLKKIFLALNENELDYNLILKYLLNTKLETSETDVYKNMILTKRQKQYYYLILLVALMLATNQKNPNLLLDSINKTNAFNISDIVILLYFLMSFILGLCKIVRGRQDLSNIFSLFISNAINYTDFGKLKKILLGGPKSENIPQSEKENLEKAVGIKFNVGKLRPLRYLFANKKVQGMIIFGFKILSSRKKSLYFNRREGKNLHLLPPPSTSPTSSASYTTAPTSSASYITALSPHTTVPTPPASPAVPTPAPSPPASPASPAVPTPATARVATLQSPPLLVSVQDAKPLPQNNLEKIKKVGTSLALLPIVNEEDDGICYYTNKIKIENLEQILKKEYIQNEKLSNFVYIIYYCINFMMRTNYAYEREYTYLCKYLYRFQFMDTTDDFTVEDMINYLNLYFNKYNIDLTIIKQEESDRNDNKTHNYEIKTKKTNELYGYLYYDKIFARVLISLILIKIQPVRGGTVDEDGYCYNYNLEENYQLNKGDLNKNNITLLLKADLNNSIHKISYILLIILKKIFTYGIDFFKKYSSEHTKIKYICSTYLISYEDIINIFKKHEAFEFYLKQIFEKDKFKEDKFKEYKFNIISSTIRKNLLYFNINNPGINSSIEVKIDKRFRLLTVKVLIS